MISLSISDHYESARTLRLALNAEGEAHDLALERHLKVIPDFDERMSTLAQAKRVIAMELGHGSWANLKLAIDEEVEQIRQGSEHYFIPGALPKEAGDVVEGDVVVLGDKGGRVLAMDVILFDLYELEVVDRGYQIRPMDPPEFDPETMPDLPDDGEDWSAWGKACFRSLGI